MPQAGFYNRIVKRVFDMVCALMALVVLSPILFVCYLVSLAKFGRPVFFRQVRPGLHGKPFELVKLRTMTNECGPDGTLLPSAQRLTPYGKFLRSTSLDELPELWNILKGEMSLVGPRPLLMSYLPLYSAEQARRHDVRPGLTGLAQISGRNALTWPQKFERDVWYVDHVSLWLDLTILWKTIGKTIKREGISPAEEAIMPAFTGNGPQPQNAPHNNGRIS